PPCLSEQSLFSHCTAPLQPRLFPQSSDEPHGLGLRQSSGAFATAVSRAAEDPSFVAALRRVERVDCRSPMRWQQGLEQLPWFLNQIFQKLFQNVQRRSSLFFPAIPSIF